MITRLSFKTLPSTNLYLKENYQNLKHLTCVSCDIQTSGRGRLGRGWVSNSDATFSILIKDGIDETMASKVSLVLSSAVIKVLKNYGDFKIKWPNDIVFENKKVAGILAETVVTDKIECLVVGIGINCNETSFPNEIKDKAISLKQVANRNFDQKSLIREILPVFEKEYELFASGDKSYLSVCRENSSIINKTIKASISGNIKEVKAIDILDNGNLLVLNDGKEEELFSGEVSLSSNY